MHATMLRMSFGPLPAGKYVQVDVPRRMSVVVMGGALLLGAEHAEQPHPAQECGSEPGVQSQPGHRQCSH